MEQQVYSLDWRAAIAPELSLVPGIEVFTRIHQEISLTATDMGQPGLLFTSPDDLIKRIKVFLS
jgi:hypothetical protein